MVRELLTAPDGHLHPAAQTVFDVLSTDDNPAAVLKWLQPTAARTLLTNLAQHTGPLEHALLERLHPSKAAAWLRAVLVARGVLPARDEYLALLEHWINNPITAIAAPDDRRLVRRFATRHYLHRLRQTDLTLPTA